MLMFLNNDLQQELWPNVLYISFHVYPAAALVPCFFLSEVHIRYTSSHSDTTNLRTVIPWLTKIIHSGITFVSQNSNVNNPFGLVGLPYVMWSAHFFVTHIQTEKISSWNGPTVHVCCFMLARAPTKTFVSRVRKTAKRIFVSRKIC